MYIGKGVIIGTFTGLLILLLFIGFSSGMIQNYKTNFQKNFSQLFRNFKSDKLPPIETPPPDMQYATEVANSTIISLDDMNESR